MRKHHTQLGRSDNAWDEKGDPTHNPVDVGSGPICCRSGCVRDKEDSYHKDSRQVCRSENRWQYPPGVLFRWQGSVRLLFPGRRISNEHMAPPYILIKRQISIEQKNSLAEVAARERASQQRSEKATS